MQAESLECRRLLAGDLGHNFDPNGEPNPDEPFRDVTIAGVKWEDANANGVFDRGEQGLPGVTVYSDLNGNGQLDRFEPSTVTMRDLPETEADETGMYTLDGLEPGVHFIREVVPSGFRQTFPGFGPDPFLDPLGGDGVDGEPGDPVDEFATVRPARININSEIGKPFFGEVSLTIHPFCIRPYEVDVVASDPDVEVINESGVQLNGCGGDTSRFNITIFVHEMMNRRFDLQFVDAEFGGVLGTIPVHFTRGFGGAHVIEAPRGGFFAGIDFGNVRLFETGSVHGRKWSDDNGNGVQDDDEQGLAGVRIYADLNENGALDRGEPSTVSMRDNPETDFDEAGLYWLEGIRPGRRVIREVVPLGFQQTFPGLSSTVVSSETGRFHPGVAIDLDITGVSIVPNLNAPAVDIELTVIWPDSCGDLISDLSAATIVDDTILISLHGHQVGDACLTVISPQQETVRVTSLDLRQHDVVVTLNEELRDGSTRATLNAVGAIALGGFGSHVVRVEPGQAVEDINFGNQPLPAGSAHGTKWIDENGNERREDGEEPRPGVVIYSDLNFNGRLDEREPRTETMDDGSYWLEGLRPGVHVISEVIPDGFIQTFPGQIGDIDTTFEVPTGIWSLYGHVVKIESGQESTGLDFGNQGIEPGSIHGTKWLDENGNGLRDEGEPGLAGVTIYSDLNHNGVLDDDEPRAVSMEDLNDDLIDDTGKYWLEGLSAGFHLIREIVPDGFIQTFPLGWPRPLPFEPLPDDNVIQPPFGDGAHVIFLGVGQVVEDIDFGNRPIDTERGSLHGRKWSDRNGNGERDPGEPGLPGVVIWLDANLNGRLDMHDRRTRTMRDDPDTERDEAGLYWFDGLEEGLYVVHEVVPDGFEPTYPEPFACRAIFCNGHGHIVNLGPGETIDGLDFGNQPTEPEAGSIGGFKWLDRNSNGRVDAQEPGLPGITIYLDLNNNGILDRHEPQTESQFDDPNSRIDETGHYKFDHVKPGEYVVREVVPDGFEQTFPRDGFGQIIESNSHPRQPQAVNQFELIGAGQSITADGGVGIGLTYLLHHEGELCAPIIESAARIDDDGSIHVEMSARANPLAFCVNEPIETMHTVAVAGITSGRFRARAELFEYVRGDELLSFVNEAVFEIHSRAGGHVVQVESGQSIGDVNFGNRRDGAGLSRAVWDGEAPVGAAGDGSNWEDPENWTVDGEADRMPPNDEATNVGSHVILAPGGAKTIRLGTPHTVNSLRFMDHYRLEGEPITIASGDIQVDAGVVGTLQLDVNSQVIKSGPGALILGGITGDVTVNEGVLGGATSIGHLQVGSAATVAPGTSAGLLQVASANFSPDSSLVIEVGGLGSDTNHDRLVSQGDISLDGMLVLELMDGDNNLVPGTTESITILAGSAIHGRFTNSSGWHHLDRGVFYQLTYGATTVDVELWQAMPGDANGDGTVDSTDLGTWNDNRFRFGDWENGDFNQDHAVDGSDFGIWNAHRFESLEIAAAAATPMRPPRAPAAALAVIPVTQSTASAVVASAMTQSVRPTASNSERVTTRLAAPEFGRSDTLESRRAARISDFAHARTRRNIDGRVVSSARADDENWAIGVDDAFRELGRR